MNRFCKDFQEILIHMCILVKSVLVKPPVKWLEDEGGPLPESPV
jgi:dynein heavy chain